MTDETADNKRQVSYSSTHHAEIEDHPIPDIDRNAEFGDLFARTRRYTMTSKEVMFSTYQAARYVAKRRIPGDIVECGVWRGGSALLAVRNAEAGAPPEGRPRDWLRPRRRRKLWLYDTFEGMTAPTDRDIDLTGTAAARYMALNSDDGRWCYADEADVRHVMTSEGFGAQDIVIVKGDVVQTLPAHRPERIACCGSTPTGTNRPRPSWSCSTRGCRGVAC